MAKEPLANSLSTPSTPKSLLVMNTSANNMTPSDKKNVVLQLLNMRTLLPPPPPPPSFSSKTKKPRKSRVIYDFQVHELAQYFQIPQKTAAKILGVSVITLKRCCKRLGIKWPFRAMKSRKSREIRQRALRLKADWAMDSASYLILARKTMCKAQLPMSEAAKRFAQLPFECMQQNI